MSEHRSPTLNDALALKQFLNSIPDEELKDVPVVATHSDSVEDGQCTVFVSNDQSESLCEIIGSVDCI